jgi:hypothetical protein
MRTRLKGFLLVALLCVSLQHAYANGPAQVAKADFSLWPLAIDNAADFDAASRAELIVSALELDSYSGMNIQPGDLGIKTIHGDSLAKWQASAKQEWLSHFKDASAQCHKGEVACGFTGNNWEALIAFAKRIERQELSAGKYPALLCLLSQGAASPGSALSGSDQ